MKKIISIILLIVMLCGLGTNVSAYSGAGTEANPYVITTPEDLMNMKNDLSAHYVLGNSIDMSGVWYEPIGNDIDGAFTGSFDGKGYTISNLDLDLEGSKYVGLFGYLDGTVKNVNLTNIIASGYKYVGGIAGYADKNSIISNCNINGKITPIMVANDIYCGSMAGLSNNNIEDCISYVEIYHHNNFNNVQYRYNLNIGGIVGFCSNSTINSCQSNGSIYIRSGYYTIINSGGVAGQVRESNLFNCINRANITGGDGTWEKPSKVGGIIGKTDSSNVETCYNYGEVYAYGNDCYAGGIVALADSTTIKSSVNRGYVFSKTNDSYSGGITGSGGSISNCVNDGTIVSNRMAGGITGGSGDILNCINNGNIEANSNAGGIVGDSRSSVSSVSNCTNNGKIVSHSVNGSAEGGGGGIAGVGYKVSNCINSGIIETDYAPRSGGICAVRNYSASNCINLSYNRVIPNRSDSTFYQLYPHMWSGEGSSLFLLNEKENTYKNFDLNETWDVNDKNSGFPQLKNMPEHIVLSDCILFIEQSKTSSIKAYINDSIETVTWSSDNEDIAIVSPSGIITGVAYGQCMVTATNSDGMKANCLVSIYQKADSMSVDSNEYTVAIGNTVTPTVSQNIEKVYWESDNTSVATIDKYTGKITGKKSGIANIIATTVNSGISATCKVKVTGSPVTKLSLSKTSASINKDDNLQLTVSVTPTAYDGQITWSSSDENVATVDSTGLITAKYPGMAYIYAQAESGVTTQCTVTVKAPATEIKLNKSELTLQKGYTEKLLPAMMPEYTTDSISWASSNSSYVSVSTDGTVTAKAVGQVIITATTTSGQKAYCTVNVVNPSVSVGSVTLDKTELIMTKADMAQLKASVLPTNATNQNLTWVSSDESVATVNSTGVVTAVDTGVAIISATANNGVYHECVIKVISASGSSVILSDAKASPDGTVQVKASLVKNPGISGYKFTINYDETILTPVKVSNNSDFGGSITTNLEDSNRKGLNIVWYANEDVTVNGELFTIDFKVSDTAEYGDTSSVSIEYGAKDICNTAGECFALYIDDAIISIEEPLPGDIYEDGEVTIYDLTLLSRYITSLETFTERQKEAADVNNDDLVNVLDVIKMAQYLTGWSNVELMSVGLFSLRESAAPVISVGSASENAANEAEIPVYINGNAGIAAYKFILDYNADDIEILSITPSELIIKENFNHNLGAESQATDGLIVTSHTSGGNMTEDGVLFTIKVRYKNPTDTSVSPISIRDSFDNMGNEDGTYVTATYETGYALGSDYIVSNKIVGDTNFSCELYFDDSYAEQSAKAIIAFYDGDGRMVQLMPKDITVKPGKVNLSIDYEKKAYATYKLMIWEGMGNLKPITEVK